MRKFTKTLANRNILTVTVATPTDERGGCTPAFSVTAEERNPRLRTRDPIVACGAMHTEILMHFPKLANACAFHLADEYGAPMHCEANAWYWLAGALGGAGERYHGGDGANGKPALQALREHLQVDACGLGLPFDLMVADARLSIEMHNDPKMARAELGRFIELARPLWLQMAINLEAEYGNTESVNVEGLTFNEWVAAAGGQRDAKAWRDGVDPSEYR